MGVFYCDTCHKYIDDDTTDECKGWDDLPDTCEIFPPDQADGPCWRQERQPTAAAETA